MKMKCFLMPLRHSVYEYTTFEDRFRHYFRALTLFLDKNIVLWSVLLLEIMSPQAGWQLIWNDEKEDYDVVTRWGKDPFFWLRSRPSAGILISSAVKWNSCGESFSAVSMTSF